MEAAKLPFMETKGYEESREEDNTINEKNYNNTEKKRCYLP